MSKKCYNYNSVQNYNYYYSFFYGGISMNTKTFKGTLIFGMATGIGLMSQIIPDFNSLTIAIIEKILKIESSFISPELSLIIGFLLFIVCLGAYIYEYKYMKSKTRIINIWGFENNEYWENNNTNVISINVCDFEKNNNKNNYINKKIREVKQDITKYIATGFSFSSIAPIPLISIIGRQFSKIKMIEYYEYINSSSTMSTLNNKFFFPKLKLNKCNNNSIKDYGLITVSTTVDIKSHQLKQFKGGLQYKNYIISPKENSIFSKKQLFNYCHKIIEQINEMSSNEEIKRIYLIFASQSSLPFEVSKQINDRISKEIVVCHYDSKSDKPYKWGIIITGKNAGKYIELGDDINE